MDKDTLQKARILIVDDEPANVRLLERMLMRAGYLHLRSTTDAREAARLFLAFQPDLLLLDLLMPYLDGFEVMQHLAPHMPDDGFVPIVVLTADVTVAAKQRALAGGARDFLTKPFDQTELLLRIRNLLETRFLHLQLQQRSQMLERLYAETRSALEIRDRSLSAIMHDLGQPLSSLNVATRLLGRQVAGVAGADADVAEELASIEASIARMWAMIGELSDVARLHAGRPLDLRERPMDLVALVRQEAQLQQLTTERHQVRVEAPASPMIGEWDPDRLARVISNLLANAIKYSPNGGEVVVTIGERSDGHRDWAVVEVSDRGIGIPSADQPFIFEQFYRATNVASHVQGTGIGLAGARQIIEQHGGRIEIDSTEGTGTSVRVSLPRS
jgi:signal transduction histidine kinase